MSGTDQNDVRHVFVVGLNEFLEESLRTIRNADRYRFHRLFDEDEVVHQEEFDIPRLVEDAERQLRESEVPVDAIVAQWDFPVTSLVPLLQQRFGLPGPDLESVCKCTNKYWSRMVQREAVPECTPDFQLLDPFRDSVEDEIELDFPFWLKPVKGFASHLGFRIDDRDRLREALAQVRDELPELGGAYNDMQHLLLGKDHPRADDGEYVLIEEVVGGRELAPEGSVHRGRVDIHGIIDMPRVERSFDRYEYPARVDPGVEKRITEATRRLISHVGLDDACFNVEFFHDEERDRLSIIEINPRISQSHCYQFEMVDGVSNHDVAVEVALGNDPHMPRGEGRYGCAAKCMLRCWEDGVVKRIPTAEEIEELQDRHPDCIVEISVEEGQRLSELLEQDSYSYNYANLLVAGRDQEDMLRRRRLIEEELMVEIDPV